MNKKEAYIQTNEERITALRRKGVRYSIVSKNVDKNISVKGQLSHGIAEASSK